MGEDHALDVTVVMACHDERRWPNLESALWSLRKQETQPRDVVVAVDHNEGLAERIRESYDWVTVVENEGARGASATRNVGAARADSEFIAFLDDDETADESWLAHLLAPFGDPAVVGTGGVYSPEWAVPKPNWFPDEFAWVVGGSYLGMPTDNAVVRNVWSGNMAVRADAFRRVGGFRSGFGKQGTASQPEDTDLCIRMAAESGGHWMFVPAAVIYHHVPSDRAGLRYFAARCYAEGRGKAKLRNNFESADVIGEERGYARAMVGRCAGRMVRFEWSRAVAILLGLVCAAVGFLAGSVGGRQRAGAPGVEPAGRPARIVDLDLAQPVSRFTDGLPDLTGYAELWVLARLGAAPVGLLHLPTGDPATLRSRLLAQLSDEFGDTIRRRFPDHAVDVLVGMGCPVPAAALGTVDITVVICTYRPDDLEPVLDSLAAQTYRDFDVLIVDNAPLDDAVAGAVARYDDSFRRIARVVEPDKGLSRARNRAIATVDTTYLAFLDDDEIADPRWLAAIAAEFAAMPSTAAVSGAVVPAELETWPQYWFENYGGHTKGRGFEPVRFVAGDTGSQSPLYPLPPFGVGANMAFRADTLRALGGFDECLGAGTATFGGEDTLVFTQLLLNRETVAYVPDAITRHVHRRSRAALEQQMFGYGVGLTAFYTALVRWRWHLVFRLALLAPGAVYDVAGRGGATTAELPDGFPRDLLGSKTRGMLAGPLAYVRARLREAR